MRPQKQCVQYFFNTFNTVWEPCLEQPWGNIFLFKDHTSEMIAIRFAGWISGRVVSLQPDTDIQKQLSIENRIRIRISETLLSIFRGFRLLEKVAHCTIIHLLFSEASFQPSVPGLRVVELARAANSPVFGPSAKVLKQSASNYLSDDVIPGRYGPLQSARQKFLFFAKFHNLTTNIFCCCCLHFTVLPTFRFTCFHANQ